MDFYYNMRRSGTSTTSNKRKITASKMIINIVGMHQNAHLKRFHVLIKYTQRNRYNEKSNKKN